MGVKSIVLSGHVCHIRLCDWLRGMVSSYTTQARNRLYQSSSKSSFDVVRFSVVGLNRTRNFHSSLVLEYDVLQLSVELAEGR